MVSDAELGFKHHMASYQGSLTGNAATDSYWYHRAKRLHTLSVAQAVHDLYIVLAALAQRVNCAEAQVQLSFGAARRTRLIGHCLQNLLQVIPPDHAEPLLSEEVVDLTRDLNVIYINISGGLDNIASCLKHLFGEERTRNLSPMDVTLFGQKFQKDKNISEVVAFLSAFREWNSKFRGLRDSAAHRIPIAIPPAIINEEEKIEYDKLTSESAKTDSALLEEISRGSDTSKLVERAHAIDSTLRQMGTFNPVFVHHPSEGHRNVYPTVPDDIGQFIKITRGIAKIVCKKLEH